MPAPKKNSLKTAPDKNTSVDTPTHSGTGPKMTPMFAQYHAIKAQYTDCLLFYRMGDFYELFFEDAVVAARELQIALTSRHKDSDSPVPMCGVPWHTAKNYMSQLVTKGFHVAVCDQVEDPKAAKGIVKREVTQVMTPGTVVEDDNLEAKEHNYLAALYLADGVEGGAFAFVDVSTGTWTGLANKKNAELWQWVQKIAPRELLLPDSIDIPKNILLEGVQVIRVAVRSHFEQDTAVRLIQEAQGVQELAALGLHNKPELVRACGALLVYLQQIQRCDIRHLQAFTPLDLSKHLLIDELTERNLEIFVRLNGRKGVGTLWHILDHCLSPMGGRLLEERLRHPWREAEDIMQHQDAVTFFYKNTDILCELREALKNILDLERISTRIHLGRAMPRDYIALRNSLTALPHVVTTLQKNIDTLPVGLVKLVQHWDNLEDCATLLNVAFVDSPPNTITDGGLFKHGYHAELDALLDLVEHGEQKLQEMLAEEQARTGLPKLKLGFNRVFGYYFELSRSVQNSDIPDYFMRRQSLANAERFTTEALKELEEQILHAADKRKSLEYELFQEIREKMTLERQRLLFSACSIAQLDYWQCLSHVAQQNAWSAPQFEDGHDLHIREGRHPVVEDIIGSANFVANDFSFDERRRLCLLTGPNMAGKSTILRQTAIICLLAQMGSYVPASLVRMGTVDRIFSRVGASDNLAGGQSTFMVEMMETARILRQSTKKSLVILDEIGRGTSTYDGLALAWAVVEDLCKRAQGTIRTLFATHYHELTALEGALARVFTMNIAICEHAGQVIFLHRLMPGPSDRSYGVEVARLAGVPMPVVQRAREILAELENNRKTQPALTVQANLLPGFIPPANNKSLKKQPQHPVLRALQACDTNTLGAEDALALIKEWKSM